MTDIDCPNCGHKLQKIWSRQKYFYGCANYPECKYTAPMEALDFRKEDYDPNFDWDQKCPKDGSDMQLRFGKFGPFLGCTKYPECKGIVNIPRLGEIPAEEMPECVAIGCDGHMVARRSRFGKTFYSCSNFPDCDVIVNNLDDLEEKYPSHPKTAYVKKPKKTFGKKKGKEEAPEKGAKKTTSKKGAAKKTTTKKKTSSQPAKTLSKELQAVVGVASLSRPEVTKKLWDYIKAKNLQDPKNKRMIIPDDKLAKVFGSKKPVDMMKLAGLLSKHIE
jgi:DNA topoisomerase-1